MVHLFFLIKAEILNLMPINIFYEVCIELYSCFSWVIKVKTHVICKRPNGRISTISFICPKNSKGPSIEP